MPKCSYEECGHTKRTVPNYVADEKISKEIGQNYRTIPTFEKGLFERLYVKHYSLQRNEYLKCRWTTYKNNMEGRVFAPFQFPDVRDLHFQNSAIRYLPSESIHKYPEHKMKLCPGPGVDYVGQKPIPNELHMKRIKPPKEIGAKLKRTKKFILKK